MTRVLPGANFVPEPGVQLTGRFPSIASVALGAVYVTFAPAVVVAYATIVPGTLLHAGGVASAPQPGDRRRCRARSGRAAAHAGVLAGARGCAHRARGRRICRRGTRRRRRCRISARSQTPVLGRHVVASATCPSGTRPTRRRRSRPRRRRPRSDGRWCRRREASAGHAAEMPEQVSARSHTRAGAARGRRARTRPSGSRRTSGHRRPRRSFRRSPAARPLEANASAGHRGDAGAGLGHVARPALARQVRRSHRRAGPVRGCTRRDRARLAVVRIAAAARARRSRRRRRRTGRCRTRCRAGTGARPSTAVMTTSKAPCASLPAASRAMHSTRVVPTRKRLPGFGVQPTGTAPLTVSVARVGNDATSFVPVRSATPVTFGNVNVGGVVSRTEIVNVASRCCRRCRSRCRSPGCRRSGKTSPDITGSASADVGHAPAGGRAGLRRRAGAVDGVGGRHGEHDIGARAVVRLDRHGRRHDHGGRGLVDDVDREGCRWSRAFRRWCCKTPGCRRAGTRSPTPARSSRSADCRPSRSRSD